MRMEAYKKFCVVHSCSDWLSTTMNWLHTQVQEVVNRGVESHVVCDASLNLDLYAVQNLHVLSEEPTAFRFANWLLRQSRLYRHSLLLERVLRCHRPSILHSHFGPTAWCNRCVSQKYGIPHVVTFYGNDVNMVPTQHPHWRRRYHEMFRVISRVFCEGSHMAKCIEALGCPPEKIAIHHLGINLAEIPFRPRSYDPSRPLRVLMAASFREKKGIPYGIEALAALRGQGQPIELTIIGDATPEERSRREKERILKTIYDTGMEQCTTLLGFQSHERFMKEAYCHDVFLHPSVTASDGDTEGGAPVSLIEVLASGMPVVATRHCDIPDVVGADFEKFLVPERDIVNLAASLCQLLLDSARWNRMLQNTRRNIEREYNAKLQASRLIDQYSVIAECEILGSTYGAMVRPQSSMALPSFFPAQRSLRNGSSGLCHPRVSIAPTSKSVSGPRRIIYLTIGEDINSELLRRQVLELLITIKSIDYDCNITLYSFLPFFSFLTKMRGYRAIKRELQQYGIRFVLKAILAPWPLGNIRFERTLVGLRHRVVWNRLATFAVATELLRFFSFHFFVDSKTVFHCRSYPPAFAAIFAKRFIPSMKIVFDPRSDFPEENVTAGKWKESDSAFRFWKNAEQRILSRSDRTACISQLYRQVYSKISPAGPNQYFIVPNNVDTSIFRRTDFSKDFIRRLLRIDRSTPVFVYLGALGHSGWHKISAYTTACGRIASMLDGKVCFLFLVPKNIKKDLIGAFSDCGLDQYIRALNPAFSEVPGYLSAADFGIFFLDHRKMAVGTKISEYLACGLPVIINSNCQGAKHLIETNPFLGCVWDMGLGDLDISTVSRAAVDDFISSHLENQKLQQRLREYAVQNFDNTIIAAKYLKEYQSLV